MVLTRNQKKHQNDNIDKDNQLPKYNTRSKSNKDNNVLNENNKKNDNNGRAEHSEKEKIENITTIKKVVKPIKIQNTKTSTDENVNINTVKTKKMVPKSNNPMLQFAMPFNMIFNISKKSKRNKCDSDSDLCNDDIDADNEDNENNEEDLHDLDCECDECDEDCDEYDEDEDDEMDEFFDYMNKIKTLKAKIPEMKIDEELKEKFLNILKSSNLDDKRLEWFDTLTKIPFGEYSKYNVDISDYNMTREYIKNVFTNLNSSVWGMYDVKEEILNYVAQCITQPDSKPRVLALCGQPGIGKTKIVRDGISKSLDRPMKCFSMGGIKDSSTFLGFDYTYVGSKYGAIVQALIDCKTMNPVLFFDELDKISDTKEGQDIENFLIHLTDPVQNYDFNDKYFNGIPIDLSKSLLIFSFNDIENISPILKDRLHIINIPNPSVKDKINIASKFFVKEFLDNFKLNNEEVIFDNDVLKYIIDKYTNEESGVRKLRRCIETICMKINTNKLLGSFVKEMNLSTSKINITLPIKLTREHIDVLLHVKETKNEKIPFMYT